MFDAAAGRPLGPLDEAALAAADLPARDRWGYRLIKPLLALQRRFARSA